MVIPEPRGCSVLFWFRQLLGKLKRENVGACTPASVQQLTEVDTIDFGRKVLRLMTCWRVTHRRAHDCASVLKVHAEAIASDGQTDAAKRGLRIENPARIRILACNGVQQQWERDGDNVVRGGDWGHAVGRNPINTNRPGLEQNGGGLAVGGKVFVETVSSGDVLETECAYELRSSKRW